MSSTFSGNNTEPDRGNGTGFGSGGGGGGNGFFFNRLRNDDLGPTTRVSVWVLAGASLMFVLMRVYCKVIRHRKLHADDYFCIAAWLALLGSAICINLAIDLGYGKHVWQIPFRNLNDMFLIGQITVTLAICSQAWSKTSFAISLLMISDGIHGKTRVFIWFAIVSMNLLFGVGAMLFWIGCTPLEKAWHPFMRGTCWSPNVIITYNVFTSAYSGVMDLVLAIIPWKIIMNLQMQTREKIGVALAMSMGIHSAAASAFIKCASLPELGGRDFPRRKPIGFAEERKTLTDVRIDDGVTLVIWGNAEAAVTIMAASVPLLRALVRTVGRPKKRGQYAYYSGGRSRRNMTGTERSSRRVYYNKPRRDLVTMTGSTWTTTTTGSRDSSRV
ncbi:hypothetical protein QBC35DRAFT_389179 [Podospora australis]|uniref:Rhodopsin domain-containing protein n=1 Tax=Podospora australis TaxID=1536484 RepID=A0AAN6WP78_9PEZI|nr:hypothetical protein QBC35DRAFT_389179 [Podospora australis]